jgi:hypothetical protein
MAMLRYNAGKAPLTLIPSVFFEAIVNSALENSKPVPTKLIWQVGQVLEFGAQKYSAHNWRKGGSWSSVINSALRHIVSMLEGNTIDKESGLAEAGHLGCNIAFLLEFAHTGSGDDDRFAVTWAPAFNEVPEPSLLWVLDALMRFRDGSNPDALREAAYELARWVEIQTEPEAEPAAPPAPEPEPAPLGGEYELRFPNGERVPVRDVFFQTPDAPAEPKLQAFVLSRLNTIFNNHSAAYRGATKH